MTDAPSSTRNKMWNTLLPVFAITALAGVGIFSLKVLFQGKNTTSVGQFLPQEGAIAPDLELDKFGGGTVRVSDFHSKLLIVNFWATWCEACVVEIPSLLALRKDFHDKGLDVAFISVDEDPEEVLPEALTELQIDFGVFIDKNQRLSEIFQVHAIPLTVVFDRNRKILYFEPGERDWNSTEVRNKVTQWLKL